MHLHRYEEEVLVDVHMDGVRRVQVGVAVDDVAPGFSEPGDVERSMVARMSRSQKKGRGRIR